MIAIGHKLLAGSMATSPVTRERRATLQCDSDIAGHNNNNGVGYVNRHRCGVGASMAEGSNSTRSQHNLMAPVSFNRRIIKRTADKCKVFKWASENKPTKVGLARDKRFRMGPRAPGCHPGSNHQPAVQTAGKKGKEMTEGRTDSLHSRPHPSPSTGAGLLSGDGWSPSRPAAAIYGLYHPIIACCKHNVGAYVIVLVCDGRRAGALLAALDS